MARLTLQETMDRLLQLIRAGYPVIYLVSYEETRVLDYLAKIVRIVQRENPQKNLLRWYDGGDGLECLSNLYANNTYKEPLPWLEFEGIYSTVTVDDQALDAVTVDKEDSDSTNNNSNTCKTIQWQSKGSPQADQALDAIKRANNTNNPDLGDSLTVFFDLHPYLQKNAYNSLVRPLRNTADELRRYYDDNRKEAGKPYKTIVIIAPSASTLSMELERDLIVLDFPLPETDELKLTLANLLPKKDAKRLTGKSGFGRGVLHFSTDDENEADVLCDSIAGAGRGLTLTDYQLGLNMFAVRGAGLGTSHVENMLDLKAKAINNQALNYTPHVDIKLGGLQNLRKWVRIRRDAVISESIREKYRLPPPKGVMLCGVSGGGKSQLAKLIAKEFNLALLRLDVGALFGMYVGESEQRTRQALQLAEVLAPVVLWLDEIDKAFTGVGAGGDNGVSARVFGHFLTWLAEKQDSVFIVATANDFRQLLNKFPEFGRKGRFDEIFWVNTPNETERQDIFHIYLAPHVEKKFLELTDDDVNQLATKNGINQPIQGTHVLDKFCWLLSQSTISLNLTGAEIEQAITDALFINQSGADTFTPQLILNTVKKAMARALYHPAAPDAVTLNELRQQAKDKHWLFAA